MPLTPRNIVCDNPQVFSFIAQRLSTDPTGIDSSPIYLTVDAQVAVSGSYTAGSNDYDFSATTSISTLNRVSIMDGRTLSAANQNLDGTQYDLAQEVLLEAGEFAATIAKLIGADTFRFLIAPFGPPEFLHDGLGEENLVIGTVTDNNDDPATVTDAIGTFILSTPFFTGTIQGGDLKLKVRLIANLTNSSNTFIHEVDASAWGSPEFRDIRGTYGTTSTDSNGISYTWSITIG